MGKAGFQQEKRALLGAGGSPGAGQPWPVTESEWLRSRHRNSAGTTIPVINCTPRERCGETQDAATMLAGSVPTAACAASWVREGLPQPGPQGDTWGCSVRLASIGSVCMGGVPGSPRALASTGRWPQPRSPTSAGFYPAIVLIY